MRFDYNHNCFFVLRYGLNTRVITFVATTITAYKIWNNFNWYSINEKSSTFVGIFVAVGQMQYYLSTPSEQSVFLACPIKLKQANVSKAKG